MLAHFRAARLAAESRQPGAGPAADDDTAPPGWDDASLLAQMQASARQG